MKKLFLMAAVAAAVMFTSCSKESGNDGIAQEGKPAKLTINMVGNGVSTKASGVTTTDATVNNYTVFVFRADGSLDVAPIYNATANGLVDQTITTLAKDVYVVANTGTIAAGPLASVTSKAGLTAAVGTLMSAPNTSSQTASNLWMEGNSTVEWSGTNNTEGTTTVVMNFLAAKINVTVKTNEFTNGTGDNLVTFDAVALLYAGRDGKFFQSSANKAIQTNFYSGYATYPGYTGTGILTLSTALIESFASANIHFYTFPNNGLNKPTIVAVRASSTNGGTFYYPVQFTSDDAGQTIEAGKIYNVTLALKGDASTGGTGGGTVNPETPVVAATLDVTVTTATWVATLTINKDFN